MSEKLHDHDNNAERIEVRHSEPTHEKHHHTAEAHETSREELEEVKREVDEAAPIQSAETRQKIDIPADEKPILPPDSNLKKHAMRVYLSKIRSQLSGPDKSFSKFIHNASIESLSDFTGKTLIRPSGILVGGILTLVGSSYYLYLTGQDELKYSFSVAAFLFVSGFVIGILLEFAFRLFQGRR